MIFLACVGVPGIDVLVIGAKTLQGQVNVDLMDIPWKRMVPAGLTAEAAQRRAAEPTDRTQEMVSPWSVCV